MKAALILSGLLTVVASVPVDAQAKSSASKIDSVCTFSEGRAECTKVRRRMPGDSLLSGVFFRTDSAMMNRAALGIELRATGTRRDTLGVFVAAVTPRGPAETAGIVEGDRIASINGVDVRSAAADVDDDYTNGLAAHRLSREVQKLTPGTRVTLRVYSGGRFRDVVVTTGRASEVLRHAGRFNFRRILPPGALELRGPSGVMEFRRPGRTLEFRGPGRDLEFRDLPRDMIFTPGGPLQIERIGPPEGTRIRALPRKRGVTT